MAEYIEREALLKVLRGSAVAKYPASFAMGLFATADEVSKLPAADVVPVVHGRWIPEYEIKEMYYSPDDIERYKVPNGCSCSVCTKWSSARTNYCPNCGARMDGE